MRFWLIWIGPDPRLHPIRCMFGGWVRADFCCSGKDIAARVRRCLEYVPADRLVLAPDCGLSQTARWAARRKLQALSAGAALVRKTL